MKKFWMRLSVWIWAAMVVASAGTEPVAPPGLYNPYERPKNGPPLKNLFEKAHLAWIFQKLGKPTHHPAARMPEFKFSDEEVLDVMAYLQNIGEPPPPSAASWPPWAHKQLEDLTDKESGIALALMEKGRRTWNIARCSICHAIRGPGGKLVGGYVDLRVGGIDLQIAGAKLQRDWLYRWLQDPKKYFPHTLMPRFRLSDDELRALTEYILRDDVFRPDEEEKQQKPAPPIAEALQEPQRIVRGKRLIELSRCVVCHDIGGIAELLPQPAALPPPPAGSFEFLAHDVRCLSCHTIEGHGGTYAPDLTQAGSRLRKQWIAKFVETPDIIRPLSQQMPKFNLTTEEAGHVAAYLEKNRRDNRIPTEIPGGPVAPQEIVAGKQLYKIKGCVACHQIGDGPGGVVGPSFVSVGDRLQPGNIWYHLKNPHVVNPYSAEPNFNLTDKEARDLAAYLSARKK